MLVAIMAPHQGAVGPLRQREDALSVAPQQLLLDILAEQEALLAYLRTLNLELNTKVLLKGQLETRPMEIDLQKMLAWSAQYRSELRQTEYQQELADPDVAHAEYTPDQGKSNPFLHLSMHLAITEQLSIDQPAGIRRAHERLVARMGSTHEAQHAIMECLGEIIWDAQRTNTPPDTDAYLALIERRASRD